VTTLPAIPYEPTPNELGIDTNLRSLPIPVLESAMRVSEFHDRAHRDRLIQYMTDVDAHGHLFQLTALALYTVGHHLFERLWLEGYQLPADWFDNAIAEGEQR
jgi:hypothetical protein